jgi:5-formyltetrahydrofolate cyclo-ligase
MDRLSMAVLAARVAQSKIHVSHVQTDAFGARLAHGLWSIPYPVDGHEVTPTVVLAPVVGFDRQRYRLGYGGGFFDRTLAVLRPKPLVVGLGYLCTAIETIFPQPHDIPMDRIVTGT